MVKSRTTERTLLLVDESIFWSVFRQVSPPSMKKKQEEYLILSEPAGEITFKVNNIDYL